MAVTSEDISPKRCIDYANEVIQLCGLAFPTISSIKHINGNFFVSLFERTTNHTVPDLLLSEDSITEAHNIQAVIDTLSLDLLGLSLSHITGEDIVSGNVISIINLLEVFEALFVHVTKEESYDALGSEQNSKSSSVHGRLNETFTLGKSSSEDEENVPRPRILKRKTCKSTRSKPRPFNLRIQADVVESVLHPSEKKSDVSVILKPPLKRKNSKPVETIYKRPNVEGIEDLYESDFEKKVKALLHSDRSPAILAREMMICSVSNASHENKRKEAPRMTDCFEPQRSKYIQSLKTPLKRRHVPPCKKSFLLPHDLRPKSKSPVREHHNRKRISSKIQRIKLQLYENTKNNVKDQEIPVAIQSVLKEFPGFQFPDNILELLKKDYYQHLSLVHKQLKDVLLKKPATVTQTERAMEEEAKLSKMLTKDLQEKAQLRQTKEQKAIENRIKTSLRDARMESVKMRQYFEEFHKSMSRKLKKRNFSEEVLIEKTFREMLDLQKEKVRLLCKRVKEADDQDAVQHRNYLDALKKVYQDQMELMAESVKAEQKELSERERAKRLATNKINQEILKTLRKEVRSLQKDVLDMLQDTHFRELDAQNFIENCQLLDS